MNEDLTDEEIIEIEKIMPDIIEPYELNNEYDKIKNRIQSGKYLPQDKKIGNAIVLASSKLREQNNPLNKAKLIIVKNFLNNYDENKAKKNLDKLFEKQETPSYQELKGKAKIKLPCNDWTISDFAKELGTALENNKKIYYQPSTYNVIEITQYYDALLKKEIFGIKVVEPKRFINIVEEFIDTFIIVKKGDDYVEKNKSMNEQLAKIVMCNDYFINALYKVNRFLSYPMPFLINNQLLMPKYGYDERFQAFFTDKDIDIVDITIDESKKVIENLFSEFCFSEEIDKIMAIAYLLTPFCRGLYSSITKRTPVFLIKANRERAGKDYLAGVVGILYENKAIDDTPISNGDKYQNNDELRKKFTSAIKHGRRRFHSANNKGHLNNAVLEQFLTSECWRDRELGKNLELVLDNEIDVSLSANVGITYTADFFYRSRIINLFFSAEDPNSRVFKNPDLWGFVSRNRSLILSALFSFVKNWFDNGMPDMGCKFTSFNDWAKVVGGIMVFNGLGNPTVKIEDDAVGGDKETSDMKKLFELMFEHSEASGEGINISGIRNWVQENQEDWGLFVGWDLNERGYQTRFANLIRRFVGREFSAIRLVVEKDNSRAARILYKFDKFDVDNEEDINA